MRKEGSGERKSAVVKEGSVEVEGERKNAVMELRKEGSGERKNAVKE